MTDRPKDTADTSFTLPKAKTGIVGLDEITKGGLPGGRPTLICGGPGCGKTVFGVEFLVNGIRQFNEPGMLITFEETSQQLIQNFKSVGFDLETLIEQNKLYVSHVNLKPESTLEIGDFSLEALLIWIENGLNKIGAKRILIDTLDALFAMIANKDTLRIEIARLFDWLREKNITAVITGEKGKEELTRYGLEEYVSDCVILLDHRISNQISKRRLRIIKYRGSSHGSDEYPFIIRNDGVSVIPITATLLKHKADYDRISSGIPDLDSMLESKGYFKGSSILVTGKAGTGKSTLAASFIHSACQEGKRCLYLAFEESSDQLIRNMTSAGIELAPDVEKGLLTIKAFRPSSMGLEEHLASIFNLIEDSDMECVVMDPISNFVSVGIYNEVKSMFTRLLDALKEKKVTILLTSLIQGSGQTDDTETGISSMTDTWIALDHKLVNNFRHKELHLIKSRGMAHSLETKELVIASNGVSLRALPYFSSDVFCASEVGEKK